jgi:hypothetical protein
VKLSFAHAEGRNYRQLPARRGCVRSRRLPISSALRDRAFSSLMQVGEMLFFGTQYLPKGYSGKRKGNGSIKEWLPDRGVFRGPIPSTLDAIGD